MKKLFTYLKQLFCKHNFELVVDVELQKWQEESMRKLLNGEISEFTTTDTFKCNKCGCIQYYTTTNI